jgi:hypothetical protein
MSLEAAEDKMVQAKVQIQVIIQQVVEAVTILVVQTQDQLLKLAEEELLSLDTR